MRSADQLPPSDPGDLLVAETTRLMLTMTERLGQHFAARAAEFGLSTTQAKVLFELQPGETAPMRALARRLHYDASNLTGLVDRLEERGVLERIADPADRRVKALSLTAEGVRLQRELWRRLIAERGPFGSLNEAQLVELQILLRLALATESRPGPSASGGR